MIIEKLKSVLNLMPDIFYDERILKNALARVFSDDKRAKNILFIVIESGVIDNALLVQFVNESRYESYVETLYNDYGIEREISKDYIGYWLEVLNISYEDLNLLSDEEVETKSENYEDEEKKEAENAIRSLSQSEKEATVCLIRELGGMKGTIVASQIADEYFITRSVIVNALKKLEMAKMLESRSKGAKGTVIRIINPMLPEVVEEYIKNQEFLYKMKNS